jgi:hypothetical protein
MRAFSCPLAIAEDDGRRHGLLKERLIQDLFGSLESSLANDQKPLLFGHFCIYFC